MTAYDTYGTSTYTQATLVRLIATHLGVQFTERESDYRGVYYVAEVGYGHIEIQPNAIPGDGHTDEFYAPEHSTIETLLLATTQVPDSDLRDRLSTIDGLVHLDRETG
ncbi:hypothetical protein [Streptomyces sp. SYSU K217416]